jgi:hypothetical protein
VVQIGEAAERIGLSIGTIRHYADAGLVVSSARSEGGFRLYTEPDLDRLATFHTAAPARAQALREQLATAEGFAQQIQDHIELHNH